MALFTSGQNQTGSADSDLMFGTVGSAANNTFAGGAGEDLIVGDASQFLLTSAIGTNAGSATNMTGAGLAANWSLHDNPDILDSKTVPHASVVIEGDAREHWFRFDLAAGQRVKLDVDYGTHAVGTDVATRAVVLGADGTTVVANSSGSSVLGSNGSTSSLDAYLNYAAPTAGTYYVRLLTNTNVAIPAGATLIANFSLTGITPGAAAPQAGDDVLSGGDGNDIIYGGGGNDSVSAGNGTDLARGGIGNDAINGGGGKDKLFGDEGDDSFFITGSDALDDIDGGSGNDVLNVSGHSSAFTINLTTNSGELTVNGVGADGMMIVRSIERVIGSNLGDDLTGNANDNTLLGGDGNDTLSGADGADVLNGGAGNDTMTGGRGDDSYTVDNAGDVIIEVANQGTTDVVSSSVTYTLAAGVHVEKLQLSDSAATTALDLTGNTLSQMLIGNAGVNILNGGGSVDGDVLRGRGGNDVYQINNAKDRVDEVAGNGTDDLVMAAVSFKLAADDHIEFLETNDAEGTSNINLTGNARSQFITGNEGDNRLNGLKGVDTLTGFDGDDTFIVSTAVKGGNVDTVTDFTVADDTVAIDNRVFRGVANGALDETRFEVTDDGVATANSTRIVYNEDTGELFFDANGARDGQSKLILNLSDDLELTHENFFIL